MSSAKEEAFLQDILEAVRRIQAYTEDADYDVFLRRHQNAGRSHAQFGDCW